MTIYKGRLENTESGDVFYPHTSNNDGKGSKNSVSS